MLNKLLIGLFLIVLSISYTKACAYNLTDGTVSAPSFCPFVIGAKVQIAEISGLNVVFNLEFIGNFSSIEAFNYPFEFGDGSNIVIGLTKSTTRVGGWNRFTGSFSHQYASAATYTYKWHLITLVSSAALPAVVYNITATATATVNSTNLNATVTADLLLTGTFVASTTNLPKNTPNITYWNTILPSPFPFIAADTLVTVIATSCSNLPYLDASLYSAYYNSTLGGCVVTVNSARFPANLIRIDFENAAGSTSAVFLATPTCCQNTATKLTFGPLPDDYQNAPCTTNLHSIFLIPGYSGGCGNVTQNIIYQNIPDFTCGTASVTTTYNDSCGVPISYTQHVIVKRVDPPVILYKANGTEVVGQDLAPLQCAEQIPSSFVDQLYATDLCTPGNLTVFVNITTNRNLNATCKNNFDFSYTYFATDLCNNEGNVVFSYRVKDTIAPTFDLPLPPTLIELSCRNQFPAYTLSGTDNCIEQPNIAYNEVLVESGPNGCINVGTVDRVWTLFDDCNNKVNYTQTVMINNTKPLIITGLGNIGDMTIQCPGALPAPTNLVVDNGCDPVTYIPPLVSTVEVSNCVFNVTYTWTISDYCGGRVDTFVQHIDVANYKPPTFYTNDNISLPVSGTLDYQCNVELSAPATLFAVASCGGATVDVFFNQIGPEVYNPARNCAHNSITIRTWNATDDCGNTAVINQTFIVEDTTPPTFINVPENNTYYQCLNQVPSADIVYAQDNCDPTVPTNYEGQETTTCVANTCTNRVIIFRTWNSTDTCGNFAKMNQTIVVYDSTPPQFTVSWADLNPGVISCASAPFYRVPCRTATDNCGGNIQVETEIYGSLLSAEGLIVDFTAVDACGNVNYERVIILSNCNSTANQPILASYEPNPPMCRPLLAVTDVTPIYSNFSVGTDTDYTNCTLVDGVYNCTDRNSFTEYANGTIVNYPYPVNYNAPPFPYCASSKRSTKRDLKYEAFLKRVDLQTPTGYVPIIAPDYSYFFCPAEVLECYRPAVGNGNTTLDPFRLCPSYLYTTENSEKRSEPKQKRGSYSNQQPVEYLNQVNSYNSYGSGNGNPSGNGGGPPPINNTVTISEACLQYLEIPVCAPDANSAAGTFFYQSLWSGVVPVTSEGNRQFFNRFFTDLKCKTYDIILPNGTAVEIINEDGYCVGPLCQTFTLSGSSSSSSTSNSTSSYEPACVDHCITISGPNCSECVTFQSPTQRNCFPYVIESIDGNGNVACGSLCVQNTMVAHTCDYGIQKIIDHNGDSCINVQSLNICETANAGQARVVLNQSDNLFDSLGNNFNIDDLVICECIGTVCNWGVYY